MESNVEEQLKTTLHYDDKEKLRRKLALLQREYLRTAQKLQRAERLEAVRKHVRSRVTQQNHQDQRDPGETSNPRHNPSSLTPDTTSATAQSALQWQGHTEGPADSENFRRSQVIRFLLPSDAACPQTPDSGHDAAGGHRPSPALRLRSRRSRLRWERRSAEAGGITDNGEEGREQSERMEGARREGEEEKVKPEAAEVANESEELFSASECESPSLLLTHWNTHVHTETGDTEGKGIQGHHEQREKENEVRAGGKNESESTSVLLNCWNSAVNTEDRGQDCTKNGGRKAIEGGDSDQNSRGEREMTLCEENSNKDVEENAAENTENEKRHDDAMETKEEKSGTEGEGKSVGLLDSCTLVEGLLFPAEYYVRTTRRMTFSHSQPDMQAVILSQLSAGRQRRSRGRGRGRGVNGHTHTSECSDQHAHAGFSSLTAASVVPHRSPHVDASAELTGNSESSSEISEKLSADHADVDVLSSPAVGAARPGRGRRRKRGRGRGRTQSPRSSLSLDTNQTDSEQTSDVLQAPSTSSSSLHGPDGANPPCLAPGEPDPQPDSTHSTATRPSSGVNGVQPRPASGHPEKVFPIFLKSSGRTHTSSQTSRSPSSWRSLLLPSSPPSQTSLLPLPSLTPGSLVNGLISFDIHQDFHLPDDQFASLKLHKLRQIAAESGDERFASPSYNTRSSNRRSRPRYSSGDPVMPLPLPLSLTPTIENSQLPTAGKQAATRRADLQDLSIGREPSSRDMAETPGEQQAENLHAKAHSGSTESVSEIQERAADCVYHTEEEDTVTLSTHSQSNTNRSINHRPHANFADTPAGRVNTERSNDLEIKPPASEKHADRVGAVRPVEDHGSAKHQAEDKAVIETLSFDCPLQEAPEEPAHSCAAVQTCDDSEGPGESPLKHLSVKSPARDLKDSPEPTPRPPRDGLAENTNPSECSPHRSVRSLLLMSPPPASAPCPSSADLSSPTLPSLGLTPHPLAASLPLTSSPSAPVLALPLPHSPSTQDLPPPALSPRPPSPGQPVASPSGRDRSSSEPSGTAEETAEQHVMRCTHTLKAPAGGCLVDACCLTGPSGGLCVAAAGKWAVCLWSRASASDWGLIHSWTFDDPVINVFPVPDAAGLMFVTLGQLEIREVRTLSCSSLAQVLLCEGVVQAAVGASRSRVVTSSHSAAGSTLQVFRVSDNSSSPSSQPLVSPGVCVGALAPVDGLADALIGTDEGGRVFVWNLKTGQLLRKIFLGDGLSHTACLRGYSYHGVLFILLQHQLLSSLEEEEREARARDETFSQEEEGRKRSALFSLVAVNPLSSKSALAARLYPPKAWSGRLCEADVSSSSVVGLSQSGCVCAWELGRPDGASRTVWAPESEGWQLARWGGRDVLVTGHHNGDVTLHCYSPTSLCH